MAKKMIGHYAFTFGVILAVLAGLVAGVQNLIYTAPVLVLLGLIVGYTNVGRKERTDFLVATIALTVLGTAGLTTLLAFVSGPIPAVDIFKTVLASFVSFVAPAALVVAFESVWDIEEK